MNSLLAIANNYSEVINTFLTVVLTVSTIVYVWITLRMLKEMVNARKASISPRINIKPGCPSINDRKVIFPLTIANTGRGDSYLTRIETRLFYIRNNQNSIQSETYDSPSVSVKPGDMYNIEASFYRDGVDLHVNSPFRLSFETRATCSDADGHTSCWSQYYSLRYYELANGDNMYDLNQIWPTPLSMKIFYWITRNTGWRDFWPYSNKKNA